MEIIEVGKDEYREIIKMPFFIYGSADFNDLNKSKCDELFYLLFREGKYRLGIIGGLKNGIFHSPISAPFGGFAFISEDIRIQHIEEAIKSLHQWAVKKGISSIHLTLPPSIYCDTFLSKQLNSLWRLNFKISEIDLNYYLPVSVFDKNYTETLWYNARKNLKIALSRNLNFVECKTTKEKEFAYEIIRKNREAHSYHLKLSWDHIESTIQLIEADFFLVYTKESDPIASAIVFHVGNYIVQVIYWGDLSGYSEFRPMNFLVYKIFEHYRNNGIRIIDVGPSTENSLPNYGLCEFKESVGCQVVPKYTLINNLL